MKLRFYKFPVPFSCDHNNFEIEKNTNCNDKTVRKSKKKMNSLFGHKFSFAFASTPKNE